MGTTLPVLRPVPAVKTRTEQIAEVIAEALAEYQHTLNSNRRIRSVCIDLKLRNDGRGVRAVIITIQGELEFVVRGS